MSSGWSRRALLASVGSSLIAGCAGGSPAEPTPQATPTGLPTASPDRSCPDTGAISLTAEAAEFIVITDDDTVETLTVRLRNQTTCAAEVSPTAWIIKRKTNHGWDQVAGRGGVGADETRTLNSGDTHKWSLSVTEHPTPHGRTTTYIFVNLAEGNYRFTIPVTLTTGEQITRTAEFKLRKRTTSQTTTER
jgi:hypothetical protein